MLGPDASIVLPIVFIASLPNSGGLLAYGPNPGMELIPYFLGLLAWAGLAFVSILLAPLTALLRRIRRARGNARTQSKIEPTSDSSEQARR